MSLADVWKLKLSLRQLQMSDMLTNGTVI